MSRRISIELEFNEKLEHLAWAQFTEKLGNGKRESKLCYFANPHPEGPYKLMSLDDTRRFIDYLILLWNLKLDILDALTGLPRNPHTGLYPYDELLSTPDEKLNEALYRLGSFFVSYGVDGFVQRLKNLLGALRAWSNPWGYKPPTWKSRRRSFKHFCAEHWDLSLDAPWYKIFFKEIIEHYLRYQDEESFFYANTAIQFVMKASFEDLPTEPFVEKYLNHEERMARWSYPFRAYFELERYNQRLAVKNNRPIAGD